MLAYEHYQMDYRRHSQNIARREIEYLNVGSGASEEVNGPYHFPQITLRVMPLRADRAKLQDIAR